MSYLATSGQAIVLWCAHHDAQRGPKERCHTFTQKHKNKVSKQRWQQHRRRRQCTKHQLHCLFFFFFHWLRRCRRPVVLQVRVVAAWSSWRRLEDVPCRAAHAFLRISHSRRYTYWQCRASRWREVGGPFLLAPCTHGVHISHIFQRLDCRCRQGPLKIELNAALPAA